MATFRFHLEPLLKTRRQEEQLKQRAVAVIERERATLEAAIRNAQQQLQSSKRDLRGQLIGTLHAQELGRYAHGSLQHMRQAQRLVMELAAVHRRLESARGELLEATQRRRALELLRERREREWRRRREKAEAERLDDLAMNLGRLERDRP